MTIQTMLMKLGEGSLITLKIFFCTILGSQPLGMLVMFCKKSSFAPLRWLMNIYISIMRGTPLMLQLMVIYFGPNLLFGIKVPKDWRMTSVIIGFIVNYAAYFAEIYRGGLESIPIGQYEAAEVLGYGKGQTFFRIILPQLAKRVAPSVTNEVITLVKDTSLASAVGVMEMFTLAKKINSSAGLAFNGMLAFVAAGIFYYVFNYAVAFAMERIEKSMSYYN